MMIRLLLLGAAGWLSLTSVWARSRPWPELDPQEWTRTASPIDAEAAAEILLKDVTIDAATRGFSIYKHFRRIRVYDARAIGDLAKIDLPFTNSDRVSEIEARTLKPDGTILELDPKDIFEREVAKTKGYRQRVKSFAPPGLEAGVIIEFRYEQRRDEDNTFVAMFYQEDYPVRHCHYALRMPQIGGYVRMLHSRLEFKDLKKDKAGFLNFELDDLPAAKEVPASPPRFNTSKATIAYLSRENRSEPTKYWVERSKLLYEWTRDEAVPTRAVKAELKTIVDPADTPLEQAAKLHDFCRREILNLERDTPAAIQARKDHDFGDSSVNRTLKKRQGTPLEINELWVALARAAGIDARLAAASNRDLFEFDPGITEPFMTPNLVGAMQVDGSWYMADPGSTFLPFGMLPAANSDTAVNIADKKESLVFAVPGSTAEASRRLRRATLSLSPDGTLEGDVSEIYSGYWSFLRKRSYEKDTSEEREEALRDRLRETLKGAEVTAVVLTGADDVAAPLELSYHLKVPDYAERTGSRLFVAPAVFQRGGQPLFTAATRDLDLCFDFRYLEADEISIEYPEGYELEAPAAPAQVNFGNLARAEIHLTAQPKHRMINLQRFFALQALRVGKQQYGAVKQAFEAQQQADDHVLTLRRIRKSKRATPAAATGATDGATETTDGNESTTADEPSPEV